MYARSYVPSNGRHLPNIHVTVKLVNYSISNDVNVNLFKTENFPFRKELTIDPFPKNTKPFKFIKYTYTESAAFRYGYLLTHIYSINSYEK